MTDETWWYLCDTCAVQHYGMGSMLFGCESVHMTIKPTTDGRIEPTKLCKHYEPREGDGVECPTR